MPSLLNKVLVFFVILFAFCLCAHSAPLDYEIIDPSRVGQTHETDKDIAVLKKAKDDANHQIDRMHDVVQNHERPYNKLLLTKAFGKNYNIHEIKANVGQLKSSTVKVQNVRGDIGSGNAKTTRPDNHLEFDHKYYTKKTDRERAGTLIHEAAHAVFNAHDHFTNDADPKNIHGVSSGSKKRLQEAQMRAHEAAQIDAKRQGKKPPRSKDLKSVTLSGYIKGSEFNTLKAKGSHAMHQNADSYKALGHLATYGLLAPLDRDRRKRPPLIDNTGIPSALVRHGGSKIPISAKRLGDSKNPVINPYTSRPLRRPKSVGESHTTEPRVRPDRSKAGPSKIPVSSQLKKIRQEKEKSGRLSPNSRLKLYSEVAKNAHDNKHVLQTAVHAQTSRRKDVVREKPLPPLPHEISHAAQRQRSPPRSKSPKRPSTERHASGRKVNSPSHPKQTPSRGPSRQGVHRENAKHSSLSKRPASPPKAGSSKIRTRPVASRPGSPKNHPQRAGSPPRPKTPPKRTNSPKQKAHKRK